MLPPPLTSAGSESIVVEERHLTPRYANDVVAVSVVIPSFDSESLLRRALTSVLTQTAQDFEIIVIDDGSQAPPHAITKLDARIRLVSQRNRGVSIARNVGVDVADGEYIAFLDQDDEWLPHKLELQMAHVQTHPAASFWCTGFYWVAGDSATPSHVVELTYRGLLHDQSVILSSMLVRRSDYQAVGGHDPLLVQMQDWDLFLRLAADGQPPAMLADRLVRYHLHDSNASQNYRLAARERFAILDAHGRRARLRADDETALAVTAGRRRTRELFAEKAIQATRRSLSAEQRAEALSHFSFGARLSPRTAVRAITVSASVRIRQAVSEARTRARRLSRP